MTTFSLIWNSCCLFFPFYVESILYKELCRGEFNISCTSLFRFWPCCPAILASSYCAQKLTIAHIKHKQTCLTWFGNWLWSWTLNFNIWYLPKVSFTNSKKPRNQLNLSDYILLHIWAIQYYAMGLPTLLVKFVRSFPGSNARRTWIIFRLNWVRPVHLQQVSARCTSVPLQQKLQLTKYLDLICISNNPIMKELLTRVPIRAAWFVYLS